VARIKNFQLPLWASREAGRGFGKTRASHGGSLARGRRKEKRPLSFKRPMHLVLRSEKAHGAWNLLRHERTVDALLRKQARRHHVKIQHYVNVGNHLHIKLRVYSRESFGAFLKSFSALLARAVTGARRGHALRARFWDGLAFTRILYRSIEEKFLARYFTANSLEARFGSAIRNIFLGKDHLSRNLGYG
jgi:hypothetical protein